MAETSTLVLRDKVEEFVKTHGEPKRTKEHGEFMVLYYDGEPKAKRAVAAKPKKAAGKKAAKKTKK